MAAISTAFLTTFGGLPWDYSTGYAASHLRPVQHPHAHAAVAESQDATGRTFRPFRSLSATRAASTKAPLIGLTSATSGPDQIDSSFCRSSRWRCGDVSCDPSSILLSSPWSHHGPVGQERKEAVTNVIGSKAVETGEVVWHASATMPADYHTLCYLSLNDDQFEQVEPTKGQKVECEHCKAVWLQAKRFKSQDFVVHND